MNGSLQIQLESVCDSLLSETLELVDLGEIVWEHPSEDNRISD